jgi:hypothetical protein
MWDAYAKVSYEKIQAAKARAETTDELTQELKDDLKRAADRSQAADSRALVAHMLLIGAQKLHVDTNENSTSSCMLT